MNLRPDDPDELLAGLTSEQRDAVTTKASPLCIVAGAGSGKTRVLTHRIAWQAATGMIDPRRVLAVTFTRRAAHELRRRTRRLGIRDDIAAGTFHATALAVLRSHWDANHRRAPELLTSRRAFLAGINPRLDRSTVADLDAEIGWARARLLTPECYPRSAADAGRRPARGREFVAERYVTYEAAKRKRRLLDFDDLLALCHSTMRRDEKFAAAQRWRHRHLFVDEFQDVNPLQFALLESWLDDSSTLTVVGDPDQAIYGWNGADPEFIREVDRHLPGTTIVHLRTNFRSTPEILGAAGRVLDRDPQPAVKPSGDEPSVRVLEGTEEATSVARAVRSRHRPGAPWNRQAILARTNAQLLTIDQALQKAGIPTRTRGDAALSRRPEITDLVQGWNPTASLAAVLADERGELRFAGDGERGVTVEVFLDLAQAHVALDPSASVEDFMVGLRRDDQSYRGGDAVDLATFHSAKGLEWPVVHIIGMEQGYVPITFARSRSALEEERRLLHVAATRAESELHLYWCRRRAKGDSLVEREPSPWLDAFIADTDGTTVSVPDIETIRAALVSDVEAAQRTCHAATEAAPIPDETVRIRLLDWRCAMAHASLIEPTAIITDDVIDLLVSRRPASVVELAEVGLLGPGRARRWGRHLLDLLHGPSDR